MELRFKNSNLSAKSRFVIAGVLYCIAALVQWNFTSGFFRLFGVILAAIALPFLAVKSFSTKPNDQGLENWRAVSMKEINRILKNSNEIKKVSIPAWYYKFSAVSVLIFILIVVVSFFVGSISNAIGFVFLDLLLCFIPVLFFGSISKWKPTDLLKKLSLMKPIFNATLPHGVKLIPFIRFDEDDKGLPVPEDVKFSYEILAKKNELNMVQFQLAWNDGPNGTVPYLYAVYLFSKKGSLYSSIKILYSGKFIIEDSDQEDENSNYQALVVRQRTSDGGYFTDENDRELLVGFVLKTLQ